MADTNTSGDSSRPKLSLRSRQTAGEEKKNASPQQTEASESVKTSVSVERQDVRPRLTLKEDKGNDEPAKPAPAAEKHIPSSKPSLSQSPERQAEELPSSGTPLPAQTPPAARDAAKTPDAAPTSTPEAERMPTETAAGRALPPPLPKASAEPLRLPSSPPGAVPAPKPVKLKASEPAAPERTVVEETETSPGHRPFMTLFAILALIVVLCGGVYFIATSGFLGSLMGSGGEEAGTSEVAVSTSSNVGNKETGVHETQAAKGPKGIFERVESVTDKVAENVALYDEITIGASAPAKATPSPTAQMRTPATPPTRPTAPSAEVESFLARLTVSMVRTSSEGARIMVDSVIYNQGDVLDPATGLTLVGADSQQKQLIFRDSRGVVYRKPY